jgi:hypothetical protein
MKSAQQRADDLERRLTLFDKHDPRRGTTEAELRYWRTKAIRSDVRAMKRRAA